MSARGSLNDEPSKNPLKVWYPDLYKGKSHMDYYHFIQQCENHFKIARAIGTNCTSFAAIFLSDNINIHWAQYKKRHQAVSEIPISWSEFKAFLIKDLGESRSFVDGIWSKFRRDFQYQLEEVRD